MPSATFRTRSREGLWFKFWLASRLGMTVGELEDRITPIEYDYWKYWHSDYEREPFRL